MTTNKIKLAIQAGKCLLEKKILSADDYIIAQGFVDYLLTLTDKDLRCDPYGHPDEFAYVFRKRRLLRNFRDAVKEGNPFYFLKERRVYGTVGHTTLFSDEKYDLYELLSILEDIDAENELLN
jgi:hypothetical protein